MTTCDRALQLLNDKRLTQAAMAEFLEVRPSTVSYWFTQGGDIPSKYLIKVCEFLGTTPNFLFTGSETVDEPEQPVQDVQTEQPERPADNSMGLSEDEEELIRIYQNLDREGKTMVLATAYTQRTRIAQKGNDSASIASATATA